MTDWSIDVPESLTVGLVNAGHVTLDQNGIHAYGPDGVSLVLDYQNATGTLTLTAGGSIAHAVAADTVPGAGVTGTVANATAATTVPGAGVTGTVANATAATTATSLSGGGAAAGVTTISGELVVGNPAGAHVVIGSDALGADGVRLYASDGVTPLIDLTIAGTPSIIGAVFATAATGKRVVIDSQGYPDQVRFFTGQPNENQEGQVQVSYQGTGSSAQGIVIVAPPAFIPDPGHIGYLAELSLTSSSPDSTALAVANLSGNHVVLQAGAIGGGAHFVTWDGDTLDVEANSTATGYQVQCRTFGAAKVSGLQFIENQSGWQTRFGMVQGSWWHAGMDGGGIVKWGYDGTSFRHFDRAGTSRAVPFGLVAISSMAASGANANGQFWNQLVQLTAGRWYEVTVQVFDFQTTVAGDRFSFQPAINGVATGASITVPFPATLTEGKTWTFLVQASASGNINVGVTQTRAAGTGTCNLNGGQVAVKDVSGI